MLLKGEGTWHTKFRGINKFIVETFEELAMLTDEERAVLRTRVSGMTIVEQSMKLGMSTSKVSAIIKRLKKKYDDVEKYTPLLPPRKHSAKEDYMDTH